jgi:hypothetical protein
MHINFTYQVGNVCHLDGVMNHIFSARMWPLIKHCLVQDQGYFDELFDRSHISFHLVLVFDGAGEDFDVVICCVVVLIFCVPLPPIVASEAGTRIVVSHGTALRRVVLVLIQDMRMFALRSAKNNFFRITYPVSRYGESVSSRWLSFYHKH